MSTTLLRATYFLRSPPAEAARRAEALALEQSIEMPLEAVTDERVLREVVARVAEVTPQANGTVLAHVELSLESIGDDAGQLLNMLFGNSSLLDDVQLVDVGVPLELITRFGGPHLGIDGLRRLTAAEGRPLTCTALKPIGSSIEALAAMAHTFAAAGIDVIKDDHGWANQTSAPFRERVVACQRAIGRAAAGRSARSLYAPSLSGHFDEMRAQIRFALEHGVKAVLVAPMIVGVSTFNALRREFPSLAFVAHPALAGHEIRPSLLLGKLFRLFGADAVIFPNHGGRFSYSREECRAIAGNLRAPCEGLRPALPVPAGGMSVERVPELVAEYGRDVMLLIGGSLLMARERMAERGREFVASVAAASASSASSTPEAVA